MPKRSPTQTGRLKFFADITRSRNLESTFMGEIPIGFISVSAPSMREDPFPELIRQSQQVIHNKNKILSETLQTLHRHLENGSLSPFTKIYHASYSPSEGYPEEKTGVDALLPSADTVHEPMTFVEFLLKYMSQPLWNLLLKQHKTDASSSMLSYFQGCLQDPSLPAHEPLTEDDKYRIQKILTAPSAYYLQHIDGGIPVDVAVLNAAGHVVRPKNRKKASLIEFLECSRNPNTGLNVTLTTESLSASMPSDDQEATRGISATSVTGSPKRSELADWQSAFHQIVRTAKIRKYVRLGICVWNLGLLTWPFMNAMLQGSEESPETATTFSQRLGQHTPGHYFLFQCLCMIPQLSFKKDKPWTFAEFSTWALSVPKSAVVDAGTLLSEHREIAKQLQVPTDEEASECPKRFHLISILFHALTHQPIEARSSSALANCVHALARPSHLSEESCLELLVSKHHSHFCKYFIKMLVFYNQPTKIAFESKIIPTLCEAHPEIIQRLIDSCRLYANDKRMLAAEEQFLNKSSRFTRPSRISFAEMADCLETALLTHESSDARHLPSRHTATTHTSSTPHFTLMEAKTTEPESVQTSWCEWLWGCLDPVVSV